MTLAAEAPLSPRVFWLTGISGAGKSTIAACIADLLRVQGCAVAVLDGDQLRRGLTRDLGFSESDRAENVRRVAEVARLMVDAGLVVIVALISPYRAGRDAARGLFGPGQFIEVFVDTPLSVAEGRDVKGLYRRARQGQLTGLTGVDAPYEAPVRPELAIDTLQATAEQAARQIIAYGR